MAFGILQYNDSGATAISSGSAATVLGSNSTPGNAVAVAVFDQSDSLGTATISSPIGTFYRINSYQMSTIGLDVTWFICPRATGSAETITVTLNGGGTYFAFAYELNGGYVPGAQDGGGNGTSGGTTESVTVACAVGDIVLGAVGCFNFGGSPITGSPASPWVLSNFRQGLSNSTQMQAAAIVATSTSETVTWTSTSSYYAIGALHLTPLGGGPTGSFVSAGNVSNGGTFSVSPTAVGDLMGVFIAEGSDIETGPCTLSGGGVSSWAIAAGGYDSTTQNDCEVQVGVVTSTGSSNVTLTNTDGRQRAVAYQQFTIGVPATWTVGPTGTNRSTATVPSLSPTKCGLWLGTSVIQGGTPVWQPAWNQYVSGYFGSVLFAGFSGAGPGPGTVQPSITSGSSYENWAVCMMYPTPISAYAPSRRGGMPQAVNRAANWMKQSASGLFTPEHERERIIVPRLGIG